jgi:hypothetical protein
LQPFHQFLFIPTSDPQAIASHKTKHIMPIDGGATAALSQRCQVHLPRRLRSQKKSSRYSPLVSKADACSPLSTKSTNNWKPQERCVARNQGCSRQKKSKPSIRPSPALTIGVVGCHKRQNNASKKVPTIPPARAPRSTWADFAAIIVYNRSDLVG